MRVGPAMSRAVAYVALHPGAPIGEVSRAVGPHGSRKYGGEIVYRCLKAGLIVTYNEGRYRRCFESHDAYKLWLISTEETMKENNDNV